MDDGGNDAINDARQRWPAAERNRAPILEVLRGALPAKGLVLEVASGTGQHAAWFGAGLPTLTWQPTDRDDEMFASIRGWAADAGAGNVREPAVLDVSREPWPVDEVAAVFNANMIHISPWAVCQALMAGVGPRLAPGGPLVLYGPFRIDGTHTADTNAAFDADLRRRDPRWGVRDLESVAAEASRHGLELEQRIAMPANNFSLIFRRSG